eukprot:11777940-Alexandrium_andersonii.AAC.1
MWLALHARSTVSPSSRAASALAVVAWLVPVMVFEQRALLLLAAAGVDGEPSRAWSSALQRRGRARPDQLPALAAA